MSDRVDLANLVARLNEAADLLKALKAGKLGELLGRGGNVAGCDYHCICNDSHCRCNGSVKSSSFDTISYPEFMAAREARMNELRRELALLQVPEGLPAPPEPGPGKAR